MFSWNFNQRETWSFSISTTYEHWKANVAMQHIHAFCRYVVICHHLSGDCPGVHVADVCIYTLTCCLSLWTLRQVGATRPRVIHAPPPPRRLSRLTAAHLLPALRLYLTAHPHLTPKRGWTVQVLPSAQNLSQRTRVISRGKKTLTAARWEPSILL